jgi:hypothetical protein
MTAITLHRSDPAKNLHRYYRLDVQHDLFGAWCFIREWGARAAPVKRGKSPTLPPPRHRPRLTGSAGPRSARDMPHAS